MDVSACFPANVSQSVRTVSTLTWITKAHTTPLRRLQIKFTVEAHTKTHWTIYTNEKQGRFNLKIGMHSSFLQMKARKWKTLESCLLWKSKVMNNASVSIIKSVLIRLISRTPADWKAHGAALLTNQEWDKNPLGPWTSHPPCWTLSRL